MLLIETEMVSKPEVRVQLYNPGQEFQEAFNVPFLYENAYFEQVSYPILQNIQKTRWSELA